MIYQPTNVIPSNLSGVGNGVVDVNDDYRISWIVSGNSLMDGFRVTIYDADDLSTPVYTDALSTIAFYGKDAEGNPVPFISDKNHNQLGEDTPGMETWADMGLVNGKSYVMFIRQAWDNRQKFVDQTSGNYFVTREKPVISFGNYAKPLKSAKETITASYYQAEGDSIAWVQWSVIEEGAVVYSSERYQTGLLSFTYDSYQTGKYYSVKISGRTTSGAEIDAETDTFLCSYIVVDSEIGFGVSCGDQNNSVLTFPPAVSIPGTATPGGGYTIENGILHLNAGANVVWNTVDGEPMDLEPGENGYNVLLKAKRTDRYEETGDFSDSFADKAAMIATPPLRNSIGVVKGNRIQFYKMTSGGLSLSGTQPGGPTLIQDSINCAVFSDNNASYLYLGGTGGINFCAFRVTWDADDNFSALQTPVYFSKSFLAPVTKIATFKSSNKFYVLAGNAMYYRDNYFVRELGFTTPTDYGTMIDIAISWDGTTAACLFKNGNTYTIALSNVSGDATSNKGLSTFYANETIQLPAHFVPRKVDMFPYKNSFHIIADNTPTPGPIGTSDIYDFAFYTDNAGITSKTSSLIYRYLDFGDGGVRHVTYDTVRNKGLICGSFVTEDYSETYHAIPFTCEDGYGLCPFVPSAGVTVSGNSEDILYPIAGYCYYKDGADTLFRLVTSDGTEQIEKFVYYDEKPPLKVMEIGSLKTIEVTDGANNLKVDLNNATETRTLFFNSAFSEYLLQVSPYPDDPAVYNIICYRPYSLGYLMFPNVPYTQDNIDSVTVYGKQEIIYIYIAHLLRGASSETFDYIPPYNIYTMFYANFLNELDAGTSFGDNVLRRVLRRDSKGKLKLIEEKIGNLSEIKDFSTVSSENYDYYLENIFLNAHYSSSVLTTGGRSYSAPYPSFTLIEAEETGNKKIFNALHVWLFGNRMEAGSVSNNNAPSFFQNFTRYPAKQWSSQHYKSGTLNALLKNFVNGEYADTAYDMEELYAISESTNPFFLKDTKGNLYRVAISGPITQSVNTRSGVQEVTVSIPWTEIADASDVSIVEVK